MKGYVCFETRADELFYVKKAQGRRIEMVWIARAAVAERPMSAEIYLLCIDVVDALSRR